MAACNPCVTGQYPRTSCRMHIALSPVYYLIFLSFVLADTSAQVNRYVVFFRDKTGTPYSIDQADQFLSARSIARRAKQSLQVLAEDLPVNPSYVSLVAATGGKTYFTSRWMNAVLTEIHSDTVAMIQALPCVASVELAAPGNVFSGGRIRKVRNKFSSSSSSTSATLAQLQQLQIDQMHQAGFHGSGIAVAVMDAGFSAVNSSVPFQSLVQRGGIKQAFNFVSRSYDVYANCSGCNHGTEVLSTMAVNTADFTGGAYDADYYLYVTEDDQSEYRVEEYNWLFAAEKADSAGVDVISTSLGYNTFDDPSMDYTIDDLDGKTTVIARAATIALSKGMVVVVSAGNSGNDAWHYIETPADAEGVIACGAVTTGGQITAFSSVGPSADNRIKPDVVADGSGVSVILPTGVVASNSGTSFSCPLVASLAAGVWQAYPSLTAAQVYNAIIHSGDRICAPDDIYGYGVPRFGQVKSYLEGSRILSVYPNPVNSNSLKINFTYNAGDTKISIFDSFGRACSERTITLDCINTTLDWDISALAKGVYFIRIKSSFSTEVVRFVRS